MPKEKVAYAILFLHEGNIDVTKVDFDVLWKFHPDYVPEIIKTIDEKLKI